MAIAYVLFKMVAAVIALALFPIVTPSLVRASKTIDGVTLLAAYHTAYNVVGVLVLLPLIDQFTRLVERILPERGSPLTRSLDPSALETPVVAVEAVRRTIARALAAMCGSVELALEAASRGESKDAISAHETVDALRKTQVFLSDVAGPPDTDDEQRRLTGTLHALNHASWLAETVGRIDFAMVRGGSDDTRAGQLCLDAMRIAARVANEVAARAVIDQPPQVAPATPGATALPGDTALVQLEHCATELEKLQRSHRGTTLGAVANGTLTADAAIARVETVRSLHALAYHAWRSAAHLVGRGE